MKVATRGMLVLLLAPGGAPNAGVAASFAMLPAGTVYYVAQHGNDTTGTPDDPSRPYRSPFGAGAGAYADIPADITTGSGDHIIQFMDSHTYGQLTMSPRTTDATHRIVLRAAEGTHPTMDAHATADGSPGRTPDNLTLRVLTNHVVVEGLRFINTNVITEPAFAPNPEVMVRIDGSNVVIENNFFDGNAGRPAKPDIGLVICGDASNITISSNRWDNLGGKSQLHVTASCAGGGSPRKLIIRNNVFSRFSQRSDATAIGAALNFGGGGGTRAGDSSLVENNTFWNNGGAHFGLLNTNASVLTVRNNIFSDITGTNAAAVGCRFSPGATRRPMIVHHSLMFANTNDIEAGCGTLSTVFLENPYFVNTSASPPDLHVESTAGSRRVGMSGWVLDARCSAAIDGADPDDSFALELQPNGNRRNLGAYGSTPEASKSCGRTREQPALGREQNSR
jgi:hypothetical protein